MSLGNRLWKAFVARPFGMPIPPNFFGLATFAMLGIFINPGFFVIGAGLEIAYLAWLANNKRFRNAIELDRFSTGDDSAEQRYRELIVSLNHERRMRQESLERRASDIVMLLDKDPIMRGRIESIEQLVWLHLRLLGAGQGIAHVQATAREESAMLQKQEDGIDARLVREDLDAELRRSLEQQKQVIDARQAMHAQASVRGERIDAELERIDMQLALIREQALLSGNESTIGTSLDSLTAAFNEADRWLSSQRDLLGGALDFDDARALPARVLRQGSALKRVSQGASR
ncbi:MAG: hypothetical protein R3F10_05090 [Lysobacteraceae bacterium]